MTTPQVSVIIPTCNRPGLLPTAIRSALDQNFSDFEVVVVDDGSDLPVDEVCNAFQDKRLRWIRHENRRGGAAARNTGIRNTGGQFVAFLDDDDEWYSEKLARQVSLLLRIDSSVGAVYTGYDVVDRDTREVLSHMLPEHRGEVSSQLLRGNCVGPTSSVLLRRKCFEVVGMFDEGLPAFQEYELWLRISRAYKFDYVPERLFNYYVHSKRIWTNPETVRNALDLLIKKYGVFQSFRRMCSARYLWVAVQFCENGKSREARSALRQAIALYPYDVRHYVYFFLSFLSQTMYQTVQDSKAKFHRRLAGASSTGASGGSHA